MGPAGPRALEAMHCPLAMDKKKKQKIIIIATAQLTPFQLAIKKEIFTKKWKFSDISDKNLSRTAICSLVGYNISNI